MSSKIKLAIGVLLVVVLVVVGITLLTGGGDDDDRSAQTNGQNDGGDDGDDDGASGGASALRTVATARGEGKNAVASAASPSIKRPKEIWLRVSAAPKQKVKGSWNVSCGGGKVANDTYSVTPPHLQKLEIPGKNVVSCIAGATAQLSGEGRVKVAILRDR